MISADEAQVRLGKHFGLPPQISKLLTLLLVMEFVSIECIATRIGPTNPRTLIHKLRRDLLRSDVTLDLRNTRGHGYFMTDVSKTDLLMLPMFTAINPSFAYIREM